MWLLSLGYCMYFYTEITYVLYATSAICLSVHLYIFKNCYEHFLSLEAVYVCSCLCACTCV